MTAAMRAATHARLYDAPPQATDRDGTRHWITRAANFVVVVTAARPGTMIERKGQPDEHMALFATGVSATIEADGSRIISEGDSLAILPPGDSRITVSGSGTLTRIFSSQAGDLAAKASNAATYADGAPEVAPLTPWPEPVGGFKLRHYPLAGMKSPDPHPLGMRLFRSTNLMINVFEPWAKRRDPQKLSPHSHEDFEQVSLGIEGAFAHHLRYPWVPDMTAWREDEHETYAASPSVLVIPARVIHTTQDLGEGTTRLVDVFAPPRRDFSEKPGLVINAAEYPMPA